jgi:hypothetical protein
MCSPVFLALKMYSFLRYSLTEHDQSDVSSLLLFRHFPFASFFFGAVAIAATYATDKFLLMVRSEE